MKCICGYEKISNCDIENDEKEDFIQIEGSFIKRKEYGFVEEVHLYACPKCCTIKVKGRYE